MSQVSLKQYLNRRLTLGQGMGVVVVIGLLAAAGYAGYEFVAARLLESRVKSAIPIICDEARNQRSAIVNAIEAYKVQFGSYPSDHVLSHQPLVIDPITNTLVYELGGALLDPRNGRVQVAGVEPAELGFVTNFLHCAPFRNISDNPDRVKSFLARKFIQTRQFHDDPDVFVLSFYVTSGAVPIEVAWELDFGSWRYVSTSPTNNPGKFDLWMDIRYHDRTVTIGNWKAVE